MKVRVFKDVTIDADVDVDIDDVLLAFSARIDEAEGYILPTMDWMSCDLQTL